MIRHKVRDLFARRAQGLGTGPHYPLTEILRPVHDGVGEAVGRRGDRAAPGAAVPEVLELLAERRAKGDGMAGLDNRRGRGLEDEVDRGDGGDHGQQGGEHFGLGDVGAVLHDGHGEGDGEEHQGRHGEESAAGLHGRRLAVDHVRSTK